jgi:hypothetical protein
MPILSCIASVVISSPSFKLITNFSISLLILDKSFPKNSANKKAALGPILMLWFLTQKTCHLVLA